MGGFSLERGSLAKRVIGEPFVSVSVRERLTRGWLAGAESQGLVSYIYTDTKWNSTTRVQTSVFPRDYQFFGKTSWFPSRLRKKKTMLFPLPTSHSVLRTLV